MMPMFALATAITVAQPTIRPLTINPAVIHTMPIRTGVITTPIRLIPRPELLQRCNDDNIDRVNSRFVDNYDGSFTMTIVFKDLVLNDNSETGESSLTCTLYSRLPEVYGFAAVNLFRTSYSFDSEVPNKTIDGSAEFGVGIIDSNNLVMHDDNLLVEGTNSGTQGGGNGPAVMAMARRVNGTDDPGDVKKDPTEPKDGELIRTTTAGFGGSTSGRSLTSGEHTIPLDLSQPTSSSYPVDSQKVIVNQIKFKIKSVRGVPLGASVRPTQVDIMIYALDR